jgi:hypothetical protein
MLKIKKYGKLHNERSMMAAQRKHSRVNRRSWGPGLAGADKLIYGQQGQVFVTGKGTSRGNKGWENSYAPTQETIHGYSCVKFHSGQIQLIFRQAFRNFAFVGGMRTGKTSCQLANGMVVSH